jgi:hypothetical protein
MKNIKLLNLIKECSILEEDAVDIIKIFDILTDNKKEEVLNNWHKIAENIKLSREEIEIEKQVLLTNTLVKIQNNVENYNNTNLLNNNTIMQSKVLNEDIYWEKLSVDELNTQIIETSNIFWFDPEIARQRVLKLTQIVLSPEERKAIDQKLRKLDQKQKDRLFTIIINNNEFNNTETVN